MILADKIIQLRKKAGWSQEELAEQLGVTRQSVSKWEGAQSIPDLNKILAMSQLFGVSVDYLVKDEIEAEEAIIPAEDTPANPARRVTMAEANEFLALRREASKNIALGVTLCILSPVLLLLPAAIWDTAPSITEHIRGTLVGIGLILLFVMVAAAVALFIKTGMKSGPYEFLEKEPIETEYGVDGMVKELKKQYAGTYTQKNVLGVCLCILSVVPLLGVVWTQNPFYIVLAVCLLLVIVAIGVYQFVSGGVIWESFQKLLQEGDYTPDAKRVNKNIGSVYWPVVVAVYLGYSFITNDWARSWVIWPVAGILWAAISAAASRKK